MRKLELVAEIYIRKILLNIYRHSNFDEEIYEEISDIVSFYLAEKYTRRVHSIESFTKVNRDKVIDVLAAQAICHDVNNSRITEINAEILKDKMGRYSDKCLIISSYLGLE